MNKTGAWGTRLGFYLAAVGSAFGLGNLWRFPYIVAENGGGAFVLLYVFLVFLIGIPLLIGELLMGKLERKSIVSGLRSMLKQSDLFKVGEGQSKPQHIVLFRGLARPLKFSWSWLGKFSVFLCLLVLSYYAVVSGWVLHFIVSQAVSLFIEGDFKARESAEALFSKGWLQVLYAFLHLMVVGSVVTKEVDQGIERFVGYMMPVFIVIMVVMIAKSLSLDTAIEALRFFFYPDFSKLSGSSLAQALGHVLFTLGLGFGTMVTFGSYFQEKASVPLAGIRVAIADAMLSLCAGVLIFPIAFASFQPVVGPQLLFQTVPSFIEALPQATVFGLLFFVCLYLAALGACVGLLETITANFIDLKKWSRTKAAWVGVSFCGAASMLPALSSNLFQDWSWRGRGMLQILDGILVHWCLPISALLLCLALIRYLPAKRMAKEFEGTEDLPPHLFDHWYFCLKWLIAPVILLALILQALQEP